jgi:Zn-dependent peptidase ImmA (M78 family)
MSKALDLLEAESEAENVIRQHSITSLPVCPFTIAEKSEITVQPKDSDEPGVSGFLMRVGSAFAILYARHINNEGFIRFTVAHELGHFFLPGHPQLLFPKGDGIHRSNSGFISHDREERQADQFAAALLMPESLFKKAIDRAGQGFLAIQSLADLCKTSITSTAIRYAKYADDALAVIVSSGDRVEYCFLSERLRDAKKFRWLKPGDLIAPRSTTASFNKKAANIEVGKQEEGSCLLDDWFDDAPQVEMNEDVVGLGSYGKTLTVLFTDQDLEEDDDDTDDDE